MSPLPTGDDPIAACRTLAELFRVRVALTPDALAYRQHDEASGAWVDWSWRRVEREVARWRAAFAAEGFAPGARVATLMGSGVAYVCVDQAALSLGLAITPMPVADNPGNLAFILADSGAAVLIVDNPEYWTRLAAQTRDHAELKRIVLARADAQIADDPRVVRAEPWLAAAAGRLTPDIDVTPQSLAAIVYTSGTTGRPKGVMLSHANVVANVLAVRPWLAATTADLFLSFLPLSHTFERTAGYYLPIASGCGVVFARSIGLLAEDMRATAPTILISVPRVYERAYLAIERRLAAGGALACALTHLTERIGWRRYQAAQGVGAGLSPLERLLWPALDRLVAKTVRAGFGGRLRFAIAGGAPMPFPITRFFLAMGVEVLQGYGMTESAPVVSVNRPGRNDPTSVGDPLPGVAVKLGENDELLVKGPSVMVGYWRRPEDTAKVLERDGWLRTGDQARLADGRIFIKGRIKDIIVTSTGEKISPADLEQAICGDPLFEQTIAIGERRPFIAALAVVNREALIEAAKDAGLTGAPEDLVLAAPMRALALARIRQAVAQFPRYATPRKVYLTLTPWTVAAGLMTSTLKLKRSAIEAAFAAEIAALYAK
jgi:long-chain acyl-CoA synthetase